MEDGVIRAKEKGKEAISVRGHCRIRNSPQIFQIKSQRHLLARLGEQASYVEDSDISNIGNWLPPLGAKRQKHKLSITEAPWNLCICISLHDLTSTRGPWQRALWWNLRWYRDIVPNRDGNSKHGGNVEKIVWPLCPSALSYLSGPLHWPNPTGSHWQASLGVVV